MTSRIIVMALAFATLAFQPIAAVSQTNGQGPTMVTVTGAVGKTNREAFDRFADAFIGFRDKRFERAFSFNRTALRALPQIEITAKVESWPRTVSARGPRLADVLATAGVAKDAAITVVAFDGYEVTLTPQERTVQDWVLAIEADGQPLAIGGRGPAWLMYDAGGTTLPEEAEANWVWSIFLIEAGVSADAE